jgi:cyclic-di-AMP phosphodiesterase PgpH
LNQSVTEVGFVDAIKRWRLARQGLSSGKKRRVHSQNAVIQALEDSVWVKIGLYALFAVGITMLVLRASPGATFANEPWRGAIYAMIISITAIVIFHSIQPQVSCRRNSRVILVLGSIIGHLIIIRLVMTLADTEAILERYRFLFLPCALAPMLHGVLLGRTVGSFTTVCVSVIGCLFVPRVDVLGYLVLSIVCGMTAVILTVHVRKRVQLLRAGIYVGVVTLVLGLLLGRLDVISCFGPGAVDRLQVLGAGSAAALGTGIFTALVISGLLPIFEGFFRLTTDISWLELSDLNHKLLRRMQLEAPGTFHHSLIVASLAEAAAEKIGANAPMCRVCSYFHDIGKLKKPGYFIENQHEGTENPHDALTPTMSALVIIAHVKDGVDLAVKSKLNPRVIDVIQEHHGDSLVYYFYRKAQEQKKAEIEKVDRRLENPEDLPVVEEKSFRYPGPRPSSRESGIIALADMIESASRTLRKPTPAKIKAMVEDLVRAKVSDGQLDECPLTVKELALVKDSFCSTLRSMMHARIDYPKDDERPSSGGGNRRPPAGDKDSTRGGRVAPLSESP